MIGQKNNLKTITQWRVNKSIPRFIIISGEEGSGRLTLAKVIMKCVNATGIIVGSGIDDVRTTIENAYTLSTPTFYIFRNADDMSTPAKNSLLKVVEEPPNNAHFIMTIKNIDNMLGTIKSRGTVIKMESYSHQELKSVCNNDIILHYASNIADTQRNLDDVKKSIKCANDCISALQAKSGTKLLKALTQLQAKKTDTEKIDCMLFMLVIKEKMLSYPQLVTQSGIKYLVKCTQDLQRTTNNKKAAIECMLVSLLEELKSAEISKTMG